MISTIFLGIYGVFAYFCQFLPGFAGFNKAKTTKGLSSRAERSEVEGPAFAPTFGCPILGAFLFLRQGWDRNHHLSPKSTFFFGFKLAAIGVFNASTIGVASLK